MELKQFLEAVTVYAKSEDQILSDQRDVMKQLHRQFFANSTEYKTTPHCGFMREVDNVSPDYNLKREYRDKILNPHPTGSPLNDSYRSKRDNDDDDDTLSNVASAAIGFGIGAAIGSLFGDDDDKGSFGGGDSGGGGASGEW